MAIQKINQSFGATLKGNYQDIIKLSLQNGLSDKVFKKSLAEIHKVCPDKNDRVYLYYRPMYKFAESGSFNYAGIRSGIKVAKDGKVMELNVNPKQMSLKYLFPLMALKVKQLVTGKIQPDETIKLYK